MRVVVHAILILMFTATAAHAADLQAVLKAAANADSQWIAARKTWKAKQLTVTQARGALLPKVSASYSNMVSEFEPEHSAGNFESQSSTFQVQARQPLFHLGAWYGFQKAQAATSRARAKFRMARQQFYLRVARHYLGVLRAWENLALARAEVKAFARQLEQARESYQVGLVPKTEVEEAQAAYDLAQARLISARSQFFIARGKLEALTGKRWNKLALLSEQLPLNGPKPEDPSQWVHWARTNNPRVIAARYRAKAALYNARQAMSARMPKVDLVVTWQDQDFYDVSAPGGLGAFRREGETLTYGIQVTMPLFQGGILAAERKQAALHHSAAQARYQRVRRDIGRKARSLYRKVQSIALRVKARRQAVESARAALEATRAGYRVGTRNLVDVLNAQRNLFQARRNYANARYDYILTSLKLKATAGRLTRESLLLVNQWLSNTRVLHLYSVLDQKEDNLAATS